MNLYFLIILILQFFSMAAVNAAEALVAQPLVIHEPPKTLATQNHHVYTAEGWGKMVFGNPGKLLALSEDEGKACPLYPQMGDLISISSRLRLILAGWLDEKNDLIIAIVSYLRPRFSLGAQVHFVPGTFESNFLSQVKRYTCPGGDCIEFSADKHSLKRLKAGDGAVVRAYDTIARLPVQVGSQLFVHWHDTLTAVDMADAAIPTVQLPSYDPPMAVDHKRLRIYSTINLLSKVLYVLDCAKLLLLPEGLSFDHIVHEVLSSEDLLFVRLANHHIRIFSLFDNTDMGTLELVRPLNAMFLLPNLVDLWAGSYLGGLHFSKTEGDCIAFIPYV